MAFNKRHHLQSNIDALRIAFQLEKEKRKATVGERLLLMQYSGFGGLKFILNPAENAIDINNWRKTEHDFFALTQELHQLLKENATDEKEYRRMVDSMRSSVLTAFYTPPQVIDAISETLRESGLRIDKFLEPSAGIGSFIQSFSENQKTAVTAYEKDLLTGRILKQLYPGNDIRVGGFEEIPEKEQNSYDVIASNIPFGDSSVFDLSYSRSKDTAKVQAARSIHNYFFLKAADMLRDGGILAFITSQGILNSPSNLAIREALMKEHKLVSAIRLPNNLFTEYAGTEAGSDLIVLQKRIGKKTLSKREMLFCDTRTNAEGISNNSLLGNPAFVVHTKAYSGTNPYGKPTMIYEHENGAEGIAKDLGKLLAEDFSVHLDKELYKGERSDRPFVQTPTASTIALQVVEPAFKQKKPQELKQLSIFDLFENAGGTTMAAVPPKRTAQGKRQTTKTNRRAIDQQLDLFSSARQQPYTSPPVTNSSASPNSKRQTAVGDLFSGIQDNGGVDNPTVPVTISEPTFYSGSLQPFHRNDCLVMDNGFVGYLKEVDSRTRPAMFHPLQLPAPQKARAEAYIGLRDAYQLLYNKEAALQTEHKEERETLNLLYDAFVKRYGNLNSADNIKLIKTDSAGKEVPYLERVVGGVVHKADIFHHPVSQRQHSLPAIPKRRWRLHLTNMGLLILVTWPVSAECLRKTSKKRCADAFFTIHWRMNTRFLKDGLLVTWWRKQKQSGSTLSTNLMTRNQYKASKPLKRPSPAGLNSKI